MLVLLSPSKSVTSKDLPLDLHMTDPLFPALTMKLISGLSQLSKKKLQSELEVSKALAELNFHRYQEWYSTTERPALWLYSGDVYNGLDAFTMTKASAAYAQDHLAVISGLYGLVRPLDGIRPYRLEMRLNYAGAWGGSLYDAWAQEIADYIEQSGHKTVLMCASKEYAKAVTKKLPKSIRIVTPRFMQETDDGLKEKGLFAKYARGSLARYIMDNRFDSLSELQHFTEDGFIYNKELSSDTELVYIIPKEFSLLGRFKKL
jgi:cytoplasmic iron level regulating protein YaaA (DUF328/UPF0246 family)